jgi:tRNA-2-methylthio-N6-dimethylallyladenosine synthase
VPADVKRRRLNELLALQEGIGHARNEAWLGREVEVLVERVTPPRSHEHEDERGAATPEAGFGAVRLSGRTRHHKLVHLVGDPSLVGRFATVRIDHAGPYALRGAARPS